ncbi:MAG: hypothetical protein R3356_02785, partial [Eudoraea sp.]|nr:hypothetical protein [Eudoraea sp.]
RAPREFRELFDISLGDFVTLKTNDGRTLSFAVEKAYDDDVQADSLSAYVTDRVYPHVANKLAQSCDLDLVNGITLGCDPELMLIDRDTGNLISAQAFLNIKKWGPVGYDGVLLEFRPAPSVDEAVVVENIYNLLAQTRPFLNKCKVYPNVMLAGVSSFRGNAAVALNARTNTPLVHSGMNLTAGFHLHYGLPKEILGYQKNFVAQQVVKALDYYVGVPSIIPEGDYDNFRRTVQGIEYGKPGMFRLDHRTLEYRTPGGALMKHPILAKGLIGLGAAVIEDIVSRVKTITDGFTRLNEIANDADIRILYPNIPPVMEIFRVICSPTVAGAKSHLDVIRRDVEKMIGYARRAESIDNFFNHIETKFSVDVEENWWRYRDGERQSGQMDVLQTSI